ncbi:MAG: 3'-5' exoribonuclease [Clostridia bacterium]|nr:3'-5' exoribonuclease [Clostridia bacterium]
MNFTVIDFETANSQRASACALGIVKVENGQITEQGSWLIKPKDMRFNGMNIAIHGIRPEDVVDEPEFDVLYETVFKDKLEGQLVVAHNASFDISVLRQSLALYGLDFPCFDYLCTVKIAQKTWPELINHKLDQLSAFLKFKFRHHDALDDCLACANVLIEACRKEGVASPLELTETLGIQRGKLYPSGYQPCSVNRKK